MKVFLWAIALIALVRLVRVLWRAYTHPAHVLGRQAANMNWVAAGTVQDVDGYRNMKVRREGMEALISHRNGNVLLIKPPRFEPFADFIEVERWVATANAEKVKYFEAVENFVRSHGWYDKLLMWQGTDPAFCNASLNVYSTGYATKQPASVVGALLMEAANRYESVSPELAIAFLEAVERDFHEKSGSSQHAREPLRRR